MDLGSAFRAALVPRFVSFRRSRFRLRRGRFSICFHGRHLYFIRLLLGTLRVNAGAGKTRVTADGALRAGLEVVKRCGSLHVHWWLISFRCRFANQMRVRLILIIPSRFRRSTTIHHSAAFSAEYRISVFVPTGHHFLGGGDCGSRGAAVLPVFKSLTPLVQPRIPTLEVVAFVVSIAPSLIERNPIPRLLRSSTSVIRCRIERPRRSNRLSLPKTPSGPIQGDFEYFPFVVRAS